MIMPASNNRSNYAFRFGLRRLATMPTAKSGFKHRGLQAAAGNWCNIQVSSLYDKFIQLKPRFCSRHRSEATQTEAKRVVGAIF